MSVNNLDKEEILRATDGGLDIFYRLIPHLPNPYRKGTLFKSVFRDEKNASSNLFQASSGTWYYKDFADGNENLNAIDFIAKANNCDFKEALKQAAEFSNLAPLNIEKVPMPKTVVLWPSPKVATDAMRISNTPFHNFALQLGVTAEHLEKWNVGGYLDKENRLWTCFLFVDRDGKLYNRKSVLYGSNGKRDKDFFPRSITGRNPGEVYQFCLFGEHLFDVNKSLTVVVESEKTAILASFFYPQYNWIASRGQNGAQKNEFLRSGILNGPPILILCDADPERLVPVELDSKKYNAKGNKYHPKVPKAFILLEELNANVHLIDLLQDRIDKSDLADYIIEGLRPLIELPSGFGSILEPNNSAVTIKRFLPAWALNTPPKPVPKEPTKKRERYVSEPDSDDDEDLESRRHEWIPKGAYNQDYNPKDDLDEYGFFEYNHQYWKIELKGEKFIRKHFSNFTMKVLYHIESGKTARRLLELRNIKGKVKTIDAETKTLTNFGSFKELVEGAGNFLFMGTAVDHQRIKAKLFAQELSCSQVDVLGQNADGFFAFCNGIYMDKQFLPTDEKGIIKIKDSAYYIPAGNKSYHNNPGLFNNEKKLRYEARNIEFKQWAAMHNKVFGDPGMIAMLFAISCLFSDIIFAKYNFFPLLFLYGEGGSGKGELIRSNQFLFGTPQDPLHLSSDANTDKAKIREMAQFKNLVICLEEFRNGNDKTVNMLKGLWDRFGYKRANKDSSYGTETVPISSGVMVTGNDYPTDNPLLQRLIVLELNKNERTQEVRDNFLLMQEFQQANITSVTCQLLDLRNAVEEQFRDVFKDSSRELKEEFKGIELTDRMVNNVAVLDAIFKIVSKELQFPFTLRQFRDYAKVSCLNQSKKMHTVSETTNFWNCINTGIANKQIREGLHYIIKGNEIYVRYNEIHNEYLGIHRNMFGTIGLPKQTILDKLKLSKAFVRPVSAVRFGPERTSGYLFDLNELDVDIKAVVSYNKGSSDAMLEDQIFDSSVTTADNVDTAEAPMPF